MIQVPGFFVNAVFLSLLLSVSHMLLKWVSEQEQSSYFENLLNHWYVVLLALILYGFIFFYYIFVLKNSSISLLYPVYTGLSIFFVFIVGQLFFGEESGTIQQLGAVLVVLGIVMMSVRDF